MKKLLSTLLFLFVIAIFSLSAQNRIYPPTLLEPENADDGQMPDVVLNWAAVGGSGGVVTYEIHVDTNSSFATAEVFPAQELTGLQMSNLTFGEEYFWRVRSMEGSDVSGWSETFSFITFETVVLNKPNDGADEQDPDVELKCKDRIGSALITGVQTYEFQADTSENFDSPLLFAGISETFVIDASYLHFGENYFWRARAAHAADQSVWSETRAFVVIPTVELDEPDNNSTDLGLENELLWDEISGVIDYTVELADNDAFTGSFSMIVEDPMYTTDGYMAFGNEYFWRVRANHATDTSIWSEVWDFTTTSTVHLSSPEDGEVDVSINPLLEWDMVTGVDFFQVQFNNTNNFEEPCCNEMVGPEENFFQVIYIFEYNTTHYWRCRTMKGIDTTAWSDVWEFTTRAEDFGINETPFDGSNISIYPNPSNGKLSIDIAGNENADVSVYIMDLLGQVHVQESVLFSQGNSIKTFDLSELANGLYIVKLTRGGQSYSHKITIHK
jgi:hypothetical protein